jgi:hypothetical protein
MAEVGEDVLKVEEPEYRFSIFDEYITTVVKKLRGMGFDVTCELQNNNSYMNPFKLKLEIKDSNVKYTLSYTSNSLEGIRRNLDKWLEYVLGIKTQG